MPSTGLAESRSRRNFASVSLGPARERRPHSSRRRGSVIKSKRRPKALEIVPGASHLFPEPGALEAVIDHAARWFQLYLGSDASDPE